MGLMSKSRGGKLSLVRGDAWLLRKGQEKEKIKQEKQFQFEVDGLLTGSYGSLSIHRGESMADKLPQNTSELLSEIDREWLELQKVIKKLTPEQMTTPDSGRLVAEG